MQKKWNMKNKPSFSKLKVLSILSLIFYFVLIVSTIVNESSDFMLCYNEGAINAKSNPAKTTYYVKIKPKNNTVNFSDTVLNLKTNQPALINCHETVLINTQDDNELIKKTAKYKVVSIIMVFLIFAVIVLLPVYFVKIMLSMKNEVVFVSQNIRWLRRIGELLIAYFFFYFIFDWTQYKINSALFELKDFAVVKDSTNLIWLLLGIVVLLFAEVLSKGSVLKEEQDLTI